MGPLANRAQYEKVQGLIRKGIEEGARAVASQPRSGNVHVNGASANVLGAFGRYKKSGLGREWGRLGFEEYLEIKSIFGFRADQA